MSWCWVLLVSSWGLSSTSLIHAQHLTKGTDEGLGLKCQTQDDCLKSIANTNCSEGICICQKGFSSVTKDNFTACESNNSNTSMYTTVHETTTSSPLPKQQVDPKMILIIVVLAIMFIGICVALHLFSKARFRNHRTIFNSPHPRLMHIKLGKKKGGRRTSHSSQEAPGSRQLSICSQLSPLQSRRGSQTVNSDYKKQLHSESTKQNNSESNPTNKKDAQDSAKAKELQDNVDDGVAVDTSPTPVKA